MVGLVWFVAAFRWLFLAGWGVMFTRLWFAPPPRPKDRKHFTRTLAVEEAESENLELHTESGPTPLPFGSSNRQWRELLAKRQSGGVLWEFFSNEEWVDGRVGCAGVALVRVGKVVGLILSAPRRSRVTSSAGRRFSKTRRYCRATQPTRGVAVSA